jgi:hypothetical protein
VKAPHLLMQIDSCPQFNDDSFSGHISLSLPIGSGCLIIFSALWEIKRTERSLRLVGVIAPTPRRAIPQIVNRQFRLARLESACPIKGRVGPDMPALLFWDASEPLLFRTR